LWFAKGIKFQDSHALSSKTTSGLLFRKFSYLGTRSDGYQTDIFREVRVVRAKSAVRGK